MVSFLCKYLRKRQRHFFDDVLNRLHPRSWALGDSGHWVGLTHSAYINLDSRPDRRDHIEAQFAKLAIVPQRVAGEYLESFTDFEGRFPELYSRPRSRFLEENSNGGLGYIGCYIGHLRAIASGPSGGGVADL